MPLRNNGRRGVGMVAQRLNTDIFGENIIAAERWTSESLGESCLSLTHRSGLKIVVSQKKKSTVSCVLAVKYGAIDTDIGIGNTPRMTPCGVAHFLEHQLFTRADGGDWQEDFSAMGAEVNAYTAYDRTAYTFSCTEGYEEALYLLLSMVLHPTFTKKSVQKERGIIAEEIKMNFDSPWERVYSELLRMMYSTHPVREDICGSLPSIRGITPELLYECHKRFYTPDNAVLSVCGDVDIDRIISICNKAIPQAASAKGQPPRREFVSDGKMECRVSQVSLPSQKPVFCIGIRDNRVDVRGRELLKRDAVMSVLGEMLFSRTAPLYNKLLEGGLISPDFSHSTALGNGFCFFSVIGEGDEPRRVYDEFEKYILDVYQNGLSEKDFLRNRRIMYADFVTAFDTTEDIANTMMNYVIDGMSPFDFIDTVKEMTFADVENTFFDVMKTDNFALSVAMPRAWKNQGGMK